MTTVPAFGANEIAVRRIRAHDPQALRLLRASEAYLLSLYPPESTYLESPDSLSLPHVEFFGAFLGSELVGCGALKRMDDDAPYGEVKRVFVDPSVRGRGIARRLMQDIEACAAEMALPVLRLETGVRQPEALCLYRALGYQLRGPFGAYPQDPLSVFMEKKLPIRDPS
jgi:putative acetyltransferase